jgi:hypothetical protein
MKEFIEDFLRFMVAKFKRDNFDVDVIKEQLIVQFNKKTLMYSYIASKWLKNFFRIIKILGYGEYNLLDNRLYLNRNSDFIEAIMIKNGIEEKKPTTIKEEVEVYDELIK